MILTMIFEIMRFLLSSFESGHEKRFVLGQYIIITGEA